MMRFLSSSALLLLPCLALYNLTSWAAVELTSLKIAILGPSERLIVVRKLDEWKRHGESKAKSIVFISSSLGIAAANLADYKQFGAPDPNSPQSMQYSQFKSLDGQVEKKTGNKTTTVNFSNSASLISEDLLIAKEAVRLQGKPSLIILGIAPRDFLDHFTATYHRSRLAQILINRQAPLWQTDKSAQTNVDALMCKLWPYYSQRVEYRDLAIQAVCQAFDRSANLFSATKNSQKSGETIIEEKKIEEARLAEREGEKDMDAKAGPLLLSDEIMSDERLRKYDRDYSGRYLPIDQERWQQELKSLKEFTQFCQTQKIPLLVVAMPITKRNRDLLPSEFLHEHMDKVKVITNQVVLLDLMEDTRFGKADFSDTVHLRTDGGQKFADILSEELKQEQNRLLP